MEVVGAPILPLDASGRQIGHFRDLKVSMILNEAFRIGWFLETKI